MGSSAMGASVLRRKVQEAGYGDVTVVNKAIANLADEYDVVVTHQDLTDRAKQRTGSAIHVSVDNFMGSPRYDEIVELLHRTNGSGGDAVAAAPEAAEEDPADLLADESVVLAGRATTRDEAITEAGRLLVAVGAVEESYVDSMHERERSVSTHMGNGLAIPHGTNDAKSAIRRTAISFVRYSDGIDWNGKEAKFVVGIAGAGNDHLALLGQLGRVFVDKDRVAQLEAATSVDDVRRILGDVGAARAR
jgi:PTS system mannitol-specific IIC component